MPSQIIIYILGTYNNDSYSSSSSSCLTCPVSYFSYAGSPTCTWCGVLPGRRGDFSANLSVTNHWIGGPLDYQCVCEVGWSGTNCEVEACSNTLPGISLGSLLFNADPTLRAFSSQFNPSSDRTASVQYYLLNLLKVNIDINGDGLISQTEMLDMLRYKSIFNANMSSFPIWCRTATRGSYCYADEYGGGAVGVLEIYTDAMNNYFSSLKHTFDGSGNILVQNMTSSYPDPTWTSNQCTANDYALTPSATVTTQWTLVNHYSLTRACGYVNGVLSQEFTTDAFLRGYQTDFTDNSTVTDTNLFKRVYCVSIDYITGCLNNTEFIGGKCYSSCPRGWKTSGTLCVNRHLNQSRPTSESYWLSSTFECSVGLFYVSEITFSACNILIQLSFRMELRLTFSPS